MLPWKTFGVSLALPCRHNADCREVVVVMVVAVGDANFFGG